MSPPDPAAEGVSTRAGQPVARPSWYALERGGWRDFVTLLHPPYTAWHLSYVVIGGCLAPVVAWERLGAAVAAFALAVGVGPHALDELHGRPLRTKIPDRVLVALASVSILGACAIGVVGAVVFEAWLGLLIPWGCFWCWPTTWSSPGGSIRTAGSGWPRAASPCSTATRPSPATSTA